MTKYFIIFIITSLLSCQTQRKYAFSEDQKTIIIELMTNAKDSIGEHKKGKVLFAIDPECPLCQSYSKKINQLYEFISFNYLIKLFLLIGAFGGPFEDLSPCHK